MKKIFFMFLIAVFFGGCLHTPYASMSATKSVNVGGITFSGGLHDIIQLPR
jgi:PBP1b-binding outer membrane lipoprotein LpoB